MPPETGPTHGEKHRSPNMSADETRRPPQNDGAFAGQPVLHTFGPPRPNGPDRSFPAKTGPHSDRSRPCFDKTQSHRPGNGAAALRREHRPMQPHNGPKTKEVPRRSEAPPCVWTESVGRPNAPRNRRGSSAGRSRPDAARTRGNRRGWAHRGSSGLRAQWPNGSRATFRPAAGGTCP